MLARTVNMPYSGIFHFEPAALVFSHFCEKLELCDCTSVIVIFIGAVIVPGVRQSGETSLIYLYQIMRLIVKYSR